MNIKISFRIDQFCDTDPPYADAMQERYLGKYRNGTNRLTGWDYSQPSLYFVTICTRNRIPWFGNVRNGIMGLSEAGSIVADEWIHMGTQRRNSTLDEWIIMPDHMHGMIMIRTRLDTPMTSAQWDARAASNGIGDGPGVRAASNGIGAPQCDAGMPRDGDHWMHDSVRAPLNGAPMLMAGHHNFAWQSRFHDHIIRNATEANRIRSYIRRNPATWSEHAPFNGASR